MSMNNMDNMVSGKDPSKLHSRPAKTPNYNKRMANRQAILKAAEANGQKIGTAAGARRNYKLNDSAFSERDQ